MAVVYNPNNNLREINEPSTAAAATAGSLFRQPSNTRKSFSEVSPRRGSGSTTGSTTGSTAESTGVRHSFSSNNGSVGNNGGGSRASFLSAASSNNGAAPAPAFIEFPNTEHSNSGSVASYEVPHFRKPATFSRPLSAVQPIASSLPRKSATAGPVPVQGSAARLPPALPSPSRTKLRLPTLAKPKSTRVMNAGGSGSTTPVIENWMTGKKTPTPFTTFRRNTRRRNDRRNDSRGNRKSRRGSRKGSRKGRLV